MTVTETDRKAHTALHIQTDGRGNREEDDKGYIVKYKQNITE